MKKTFILMLTLVFALAMSAQTAVGPKKGTVLKTAPFEKSLSLKPAGKAPMFQQTKKAIALKNKQGKNVYLTPESRIPFPASQSIAKTPRKADAETVNLTCTNHFTFVHYDATEEHPVGDWYFGALDDTGNFVIRLDYLRTVDDELGSFTLDDLDLTRSYITDYSTSTTKYYQYLEGTNFTVSESDGHVVVEGTLVCDNGVTYNFRADYVPQTYDIEGTDITTATYFSSDNDWYVTFENFDYRITLDLVSPDGTFDGTYTEKDALSNGCYMTELHTYDSEIFKTFTVTMKMDEGQTNPLKGCEITGTAIGVNGNTYNFHMKKSLIVPKDTVDLDVELTLAEWPTDRSNCKSYFRFKEKESGANWNFALNALKGELTEDNITGYLTARIDPVTYDFIEVDHGIVNVTIDPETLVLNVAADLVMKDSIDYRFAFSHQIELQGQVNYDFTNLTLNTSFWDWIGVQWLNASNDEVELEMSLSEEVPGVYNDDNAFARLFYPQADGTTTEVDCITIFEAESTLDEVGKPVLYCKYLADDMKVYTINAHFEIPAIQDTINVVFNGLDVNDLIQEMGVYQIAGYNDDSTMYISLTPEAEQIAGHYTTDDLQAYADYNYLVFINYDGTYVKEPIHFADFEATQNDRIVNITGQMQAGAHWVNMTLQGKTLPKGLDYDVEDEDIDINFEPEDLSELVSYKNSGYAYVRLQNAERNDMFAMLIYLDTFDDDICFPEGTYEINDTYGVNTVQQGSIKSDLSVVYPTFYATCTDEGYLNLPLWLFRSGTVTIKKTTDNNLALEVNALNSFERTCHITYNLENTGIKTVDASAEAGVKKMLQNNQVVIMKGNQKFNAIGQEVKF